MGSGMSQYGAYGYATHGFGYRAILAHYYTGTTIGTIGGPRVVRVLVGIDGGDVGFSGATSACGRALDPGGAYSAHRVGGSVRLRTAGGRPLANCGPKLRAAGRGTITIDGEAYRGALEVVPTKSDPGSLNAVNAVAIDQYVKGVIANESPPSWPLAALEAQAVAARSFALSTSVDGNGFDLYDDTRSQVYEGIDSETARSNAAAAATRGQVVLYRRPDRPDLLLGLLRRPHRERPERLLRPADPLPGRRPRPLRRRLPAAHLDAAVLGRGDQRQARRLPRRPAQAGRRHQARGLTPDRLGAPGRNRRDDDDPRRPAPERARRL